MRLLLLALVSVALAACSTPVTGVERLYDGILRAGSQPEAEAYCRKDGNPIRFLEQADAPQTPGRGVLFRCD
jgi:putative hemolysin